MIGSTTTTDSSSRETQEIKVCQPEPTKMLSACEVDEQVFLTVSEASLEDFVDSCSCGESVCEGSGEGVEEDPFCTTSTTTTSAMYENCITISSQNSVSEGTIEKGLTEKEVKVKMSSKMMTSIKRSMKLFISCVKPKVDEKKEQEQSQTPIHTEVNISCNETTEIKVTDVVKTEPVSIRPTTSTSVDLGTINLADDDNEAEFDDPPGLKSAPPVSNMTAVNPVTSVSRNAPQFCPLEFYRQRIKRFMLTYSHYSGPLLPDVHIKDLGKKCLVLDLDETLIHSQFNRISNPDLEVPIQFEGNVVKPIFVYKRPGVDEFLDFVGEHFEVVIFTASLASYADPVIDFLDKSGTIKHRLYRESCVFAEGLYLKDLSRLGRPLDQTILVDNAVTSYLLQPENGVAIVSWFSDLEDTELLGRLLPALSELPRSTDVYRWKKDWAHCISH